MLEIERCGQVVKVRSNHKKPKPERKSVERGIIHEFSKNSRKRCFEKLLTIDYDIRKTFFCSLTFSNLDDINPGNLRQYLKNFLDNLFISCGKKYPVFWKLEFQKNGTPHFHFIAFVDMNLYTLRYKVKKAHVKTLLYMGVANDIDNNESAGTQVDKARSNGFRSYFAKYISKDDVPINPEYFGFRFWGIINRDLIKYHQTLRKKFRYGFEELKEIYFYKNWLANKKRYYSAIKRYFNGSYTLYVDDEYYLDNIIKEIFEKNYQVADYIDNYNSLISFFDEVSYERFVTRDIQTYG